MCFMDLKPFKVKSGFFIAVFTGEASDTVVLQARQTTAVCDPNIDRDENLMTTHT